MKTTHQARLTIGCGVGLALLLAAQAAAAQARYVTEWSRSIGPNTGAALVKGACVRDGILHVSALLGTQTLSELSAVVYAIDSRSVTGQVQEIWRGGQALNSDSLSNPICAAEGVTWIFNAKAEATGRIVHKPTASTFESKTVSRSLGRTVALRGWGKNSWLIAHRDSSALLLLERDGRFAEIAIPGGSASEAVVDLCVVSNPPAAVLLTFKQGDKPIGEMRLRKFDDTLAMTESRALRGNFGALGCTDSGVQVFHQQPGADGSSSFAITELDSNLNTKHAHDVDKARIASLFAHSLNMGEALYWTTTNWKWAYLYESAIGRNAAALSWRSGEKQWGATENAGFAAADGQSLLIVYEAVDRSNASLPTVVRVSRISKGSRP